MKAKKSPTLTQLLKKFAQKNSSKSSLLGLFRAAMPEIIFRTTKLEGEPVTRRMVNALFK